MEFQFEAASASVTGEFPARVLSSNFSESKPSGFVPQPKHLNFYSSMTAGCKAICWRGSCDESKNSNSN